MNEPWSKQHKREFKQCQFSLSNSFAEPLTMPELLNKVKCIGDTELIDMYHNHDLEYVPNGGSIDLRRDIASVIYDDKLSAENILVFPGGQVAIQTAALAFASGGHSIVFTPGYQSTVESPQWVVGNEGITKLQRLPQNNWQVDPQKLKEAIQPNTKFLILNEPFNPGGVVMSAGLQQEVISICREHGITILCDEVYRLLEHSDECRLQTMANAYERGISAVTMSKPWGGCGITIGWLACQDKGMIQQMIDVQYFGTACVSRASEIQARMVLRVSETILRERRDILLKNKVLLQHFIENRYREWFEWTRPNAGAIAFVKFTGPWTSAELGTHLAEAGISIKPAYCFTDVVEGEVEDFFRIGFGESKMPLALEALAQFVNAHEDSWRDMAKRNFGRKKSDPSQSE
ncbi:hypothetical protein ACHAXR_002218 [Thalassiosira sp. AJA248-18]